MTALQEQYAAFIQKRAFASLATLMADGSPQVTPVWIDYDGEHLLINTAEGRAKDRNLRRDGRVALSIQDPDDPYRHIDVRGRVAEITYDGAEEHIDFLAQKYWGRHWTYKLGQVRVIFKIAADSVTGEL